ncbi:MAG: GspH/FimT family pseudopilin [Candidatus Hydrogenedentales bacterium]|jgi:type II secretion system protein H
MTSPTFARKGPSLVLRGFTLIELLLVVALIGILTTVVYPRINRSVRATALRESAEVLAEYVRYARAEAIRQGVSTRVNTDLEGETFWLTIQNPRADYERQFTRFGDALLDEHKPLPTGIRMKLHSPAGTGEPLRILEFRPDGLGTGGSIELMDEEDRTMWVKTGLLYDEVHVLTAAQEEAQGTWNAP